jgi:hypothetical protein
MVRVRSHGICCEFSMIPAVSIDKSLVLVLRRFRMVLHVLAQSSLMMDCVSPSSEGERARAKAAAEEDDIGAVKKRGCVCGVREGRCIQHTKIHWSVPSESGSNGWGVNPTRPFRLYRLISDHYGKRNVPTSSLVALIAINLRARRVFSSIVI